MAPKKKVHTPATLPGARSSTRRRLIQGSVLAGSALPFLPGRWSHPIVQSVVLPAHAQTSPACDHELTLRSYTISCSDPPLDTNHAPLALYTFHRDSNACLTYDLETVSYPLDTPIPANQFAIQLALQGGEDPIITIFWRSLRETFYGGAGTYTPAPCGSMLTHNCDPIPSPAHLTIGSHDYLVTACITSDSETLTLTNIMVVPA